MNVHFSNAVNSVAFTWGTQRLYHAAQFGEQFNDFPPVGDQLRAIGRKHSGQPAYDHRWGPLELQLPMRRGSSEGGAPSHEAWMRGANNDARIRANDLETHRQNKFPLQLPSFLQEPFEGDETGPPVWTEEDEIRHRDWDDDDEQALAELQSQFPDSGGPTWREMEAAQAPGRPDSANSQQIAHGNLAERHALRMRRYR